jgi:predicted Zn-dependent peptidase
LLTGLLNYGSSRYSRQQLIADQDDLGLTPSAMLNFNSGIEEITFRTRCQSADLSGQLARLASCLMQPRFNDSDVEKIRQDVLNSVPSTDDSVPAKVHRALMKSLAAESSKFVPPDPAEKAQALAALKTSDLREFYANCVNPKSTCLVIAGNINPSQALSLVDNAFSGWGSQQQKISAKLPSLLSDLGAQERRSIRTSIPISEKLSGMVCFGRVVPLPTQETEDKFWTRLLLADCALIKHPIFSHIGHRLELDPGLAALANGSGPTSRIEIFTDASVWTLLLRLEGNGSPNLVQTIQSELANFVKAGLTQEELIESKRYLLGYIPVSQMANLDSLSRTSLESLKNFGDPNPLDKAANQIRSVTLDSVNKFIAQTFKPDQAAIVIVANKQVIHSLQPQRIGSGL